MLGIQTRSLFAMIGGGAVLWVLLCLGLIVADRAAWIALLVKAMFWLLATLVALQAYIVAFRGGVPNIRTAPAVRRRIIELLKAHRLERRGKPYIVCDLGSGNGLMTREIARAMPDATVIGVELAESSVRWADFMRRRMKLENLSCRRADMFACDLREADAVVLFLIPELMERVGRKLREELRPGALVISNKFRLGGGWGEPETLRVKTLYINQGDVHVYRA